MANQVEVDEKKQNLEEENEYKVQMSRALKCIGECAEDDTKLYFCNKCDSEIVYCDECGPFLHRKKNHQWKDDIVLIPNTDIDKYKFGERLIIEHIGEENYRRIAPLYHAAVSQTQTISSISQQSTMYFNALPKQITATKLAKQASDYAKRSLLASQNACKLAQQLKGKETICVNAATNAKHIWETENAKIRDSAFSWLYEWIYNKDIAETRQNYNIAKELSKAAKKESQKASKVATTALKFADECSEIAKEKLVESQKAIEAVETSKSIKQSVKYGTYWTVGFVVAEMAWNGYKFGCNEITSNEFKRLTTKSIGRNGLSMGVNIVSTQIGVGVAYGLSKLSNNSGIIGGIGIGVGIISGLIANAYLGKRYDELFESYWPSKEKLERQRMIDEALKYFHFSMDEIGNLKKFNAKIIQKKYRTYALEAHPDRNLGDTLKWQELSVYYGILMGLLDANKNDDIPIQNEIAV